MDPTFAFGPLLSQSETTARFRKTTDSIWTDPEFAKQYPTIARVAKLTANGGFQDYVANTPFKDYENDLLKLEQENKLLRAEIQQDFRAQREDLTRFADRIAQEDHFLSIKHKCTASSAKKQQKKLELFRKLHGVAQKQLDLRVKIEEFNIEITKTQSQASVLALQVKSCLEGAAVGSMGIELMILLSGIRKLDQTKKPLLEKLKIVQSERETIEAEMRGLE